MQHQQQQQQRQWVKSVIRLEMGGRSSKNQYELRKKMELAKKQREDESSSSNLSQAEQERRRNRLRFEELLKESKMPGSAFSDLDNGYLTQQQEEEEISAKLSGMERLFEGDVAPIDCFEQLQPVTLMEGGAIALGKSGMERLIPWMIKTSSSSSTNNGGGGGAVLLDDDYLVCLVDPRLESDDLRESMLILIRELPRDILRRVAIITADSVAETRRWMKKKKVGRKQNENNNNNNDNNHGPHDFDLLRGIYSDPNRDWMRRYSALGRERWSMTMFVLSRGKVQKLAREVEACHISRVMENAVRAYQNEIRLG